MSLGHLNLSNFSSGQTHIIKKHIMHVHQFMITLVFVNSCMFEPVDLPLEVETHSTHYQNDTAKYFCQGHSGTGSWGS